MMLTALLAHPLWRAWGETLLHFLWQGALLAIVAMGMLRAMRTGPATRRYGVLLVTLLLMVACLPITLAVVSRGSADVHAVAPAGGPTFSPVVRSFFDSALPAELSKSPFESFDWLGLDRPGSEALCRWFVLAWSAGVVLLSLRILAGWIGLRLLARGRRPVSAELERVVVRLAARLDLRRIPPVFASGRVADATVIGFLKPIVLLPAAWLVELTPDILEAVVAHELAHIRRYDLWINLLQRVIETLLFYHPAVWWVSRRLRAERELCCDALAVSVTDERLVYVTALESVARHRAGLVKPALALTLGDQDMALLKRIQHVLGLSPAASNAGWWPAAIVALAMPAALWLGWSIIVPATPALADEPAKTKPADAPAASPPAKAEADATRKVDGPRPDMETYGVDIPRDRPEGAARERRELREPGPRGPRRPSRFQPEPQAERREFGIAPPDRDVDSRPDEDDEPDRRDPPSRDAPGWRLENRGGWIRRVVVDRDGVERVDEHYIGYREPASRERPEEQSGEMVQLLRDLRREVEALRREVRELRDQHPGRPAPRDNDRMLRPRGPEGEGGRLDELDEREERALRRLGGQRGDELRRAVGDGVRINVPQRGGPGKLYGRVIPDEEPREEIEKAPAKKREPVEPKETTLEKRW